MARRHLSQWSPTSPQPLNGHYKAFGIEQFEAGFQEEKRENAREVKLTCGICHKNIEPNSKVIYTGDINEKQSN